MLNARDTEILAAFAAIMGAIPEICRQYAYQIYSDTYKDHNGIRPRWAYDWSLARLEAATEALYSCDCEECEEWRGPTPLPTAGQGWAYTGSPEGLQL